MVSRTARSWVATAVVLGVMVITALGIAALTAVAAALGLVALAALYRDDLRHGLAPRAAAAVVLAASLAAAIALALSLRPTG